MVQNSLGNGRYSQPRTTDETGARLDGLTHGLMGRSLGNHPQIVGEHTPAHPAFHAGGAVIAAAIQLVAPFQPTDPALDARAPVVAMLEPPLLLMSYPFGRCCPRLGPHHLLDAIQGGI